MKKLLLFVSALSLLTLGSCSDDEQGQVTYGGTPSYLFVERTSNFPVFEDEVSTLEVEVGVTTKANVDRTFTIEVDTENSTATANQYSLTTTTVTIPAGEYKSSVSLTGNYDNLPEGEEVVLVLKIAGSEPFVAGNESHAVNIYRACGSNLVILNILFDGYGSEVSWELLDGDGNIVASAALGTYTDGQSTASQEFCLESGNYTFIIYDSYGDGLSFPSNGAYTLSLNGANLVSGGGDYGFSSTHPFIVP